MKIVDSIKESYNELVNKVSWPTSKELANSSVVVLIASLIMAIVVWIMDYVFEFAMSSLYGVLNF